ncbi:MAG: hypothetical protein U0175_20980 [Caldilineaceae bacterium]
MADDTETIHQLGNFIQRRALGALVRQWLELQEPEQIAAMNLYCRQSSATEIESMATTLLHVAAGYPNSDVRRKLVRAYALFMRGVDEEGVDAGTTGETIDIPIDLAGEDE